MARVLDTFMVIKDDTPVIASSRFLYMSLSQALTDAVQAERKAEARLGSQWSPKLPYEHMHNFFTGQVSLLATLCSLIFNVIALL